ncbi:hypothetical protein [Natronobacterium texcoconense]|uniref:hypothetical protein n=1 Tax=Natronobacterium texcoconense TaxID=1095778 RepID=UPI00111357BA|nr:hypothetical protein [Natronobacterium texcoconense]
MTIDLARIDNIRIGIVYRAHSQIRIAIFIFEYVNDGSERIGVEFSQVPASQPLVVTVEPTLNGVRNLFGSPATIEHGFPELLFVYRPFCDNVSVVHDTDLDRRRVVDRVYCMTTAGNPG